MIVEAGVTLLLIDGRELGSQQQQRKRVLESRRQSQAINLISREELTIFILFLRHQIFKIPLFV